MMKRQKAKNDPTTKHYKDTDSEGETELFVYKKPKHEQQTVDKLVEEGDTLQSLAIRYRCSIEDLKRLNGIHRENEVFARRVVRVPHHPLSAALAGVHLSGRSSPEAAAGAAADADALGASLARLDAVNAVIFNSSIAQRAVEEEWEGGEDVRLLPPSDAGDDLLAERVRFNGADCDISSKALIVCIIIVIFAVPIIYVVYIAEHPEKYVHGS